MTWQAIGGSKMGSILRTQPRYGTKNFGNGKFLPASSHMDLATEVREPPYEASVEPVAMFSINTRRGL